jgi:hypothetical protein
VHYYCASEAWRRICTTAEAAGYVHAALEVFHVRVLGLLQSRDRSIGAFPRLG